MTPGRRPAGRPVTGRPFVRLPCGDMDEHAQHRLLAGLAAVIVMGVGGQWVASRARVPAILLLLMTGAVVGPWAQVWVGHKWLDPDALLGGRLSPIVSLSVALVLFEGGLTLKLGELAQVGRVVRNLVTVGAAVTFAVTAVAALVFLRLPWQLAVLLAAVLVVTGPTVIGPLLRHVRPVGPVAAVLKWEGIVIDPIGAILAVLVLDARGGRARRCVAAEAVVLTVAKTAAVGLGIGVAAAACWCCCCGGSGWPTTCRTRSRWPWCWRRSSRPSCSRPTRACWP